MKALGCAVMALALCAQAQTPLTTPQQIAGLQARQTHGAVELLTLGEGAKRIYAFLPAEPALHGAVPMVFFHHGWEGMDPQQYGALIDHLVRSGNVVLYPVYQESVATSPQTVVANAAEAERAALQALAAKGITPKAQRVVYFGYSMGAAISLNLAINAAKEHLPAPQAVVLASPGDAHDVAKGDAAASILPPLAGLPATLPIAILTGADDKFIGLPTGRRLAAQLCGTKADRRVLLLLPSDEHGAVKVRASHAAVWAPDPRYALPLTTPAMRVPTQIAGREGFAASSQLNQIDLFGFWRVLDAVLDSLAAAPSTSAKYVAPASVFKSGDPQQTYLGTWPDGTPYKSAETVQPCEAR